MDENDSLFGQLKKGKMDAKQLAFFSMGTAVATILPTPGDILHFYFLRWINDHRYELSPTKYWVYNALDYYIADNLYWSGLFAWVLISKRPVEEKTKIFTGVLAGGAVIGLLGRFITDEKNHRKELAEETGSTSASSMVKADFVNGTQTKAAQTKQAPQVTMGPEAGPYDTEPSLGGPAGPLQRGHGHLEPWE